MNGRRCQTPRRDSPLYVPLISLLSSSPVRQQTHGASLLIRRAHKTGSDLMPHSCKPRLPLSDVFLQRRRIPLGHDNVRTKVVLTWHVLPHGQSAHSPAKPSGTTGFATNQTLFPIVASQQRSALHGGSFRSSTIGHDCCAVPSTAPEMPISS